MTTQPNRRIRVALPNKGRLSRPSIAMLEQAGLSTVSRGERALTADLGDDYQALFVSAADIPEYVADGAAEIGVTGADRVAESGRDVTEMLDLGFGACRLVVAVRDDADVGSARDLPPGTRVATCFPSVARRYFASLGTTVELAPVTGATEVAPHLGVADVIVDLVSTGSTLRMNGLRELDTILTSTARLVANPSVLPDPALGAPVRDFATAVESVVRAEAKRYLMANVPRGQVEAVREVLPGLNGPTIVEVLDTDAWVAAHAVVDADRIQHTIARLRELGAEGILVTRIERLLP